MAGMMAAGHPECKYVATVDMSYPVLSMNAVRKALTIGGPTFIHSLDPCPKGWDYDPMQSHELGELAVLSGVWPLYEVENGVLRLIGKTRDISDGRLQRIPVRDYLNRQGRFAHFTDDDIAYFQSKVDEMWTSGSSRESFRSGCRSTRQGPRVPSRIPRRGHSLPRSDRRR